jgi:hypothetical protein
MRRAVTRSLMATAVLSGLLFLGGAGVAAANPAPTVTPAHTDVTEDIQNCLNNKLAESPEACETYVLGTQALGQGT